MSSILKVDTIQDQNGNLIISKDSGGSGFLSPYASSSAAITYTVTVASKTSAHPYFGVGSSLGYLINGIESPIIEIKGNDTSKPYHYKFDQSDSSNSGHPLLFYNNVGKTTQFTTGVTTNGTPGSSGAYTMIAVDSQTPNILYYQCSSHGNMGNHTFATSPVVNTGVFLTLPTADGSSGQFVTTNGSGVLSFANGSVPDDAITLAKMAPGTDGNIISYDASGNPVAVATGNDGQVLTSAGAGAVPTFETLPAGTTLSGSTNNTVATVTGANALAGEANLTFDGSTLGVAGDMTVTKSGDNVKADFSNGVNANFRVLTSGTAAQIGPSTASDIVFLSSNAERMRMLAAGGLTFNGDTGTANALDDYEEGTWSPTFTNGGSTLSNVTISKANYTKIGRMIWIEVNAQYTGSTVSGSFIIGDGLPFTSAQGNIIINGTFAVHPGSGDLNQDVGAAGSHDSNTNFYMVPADGNNRYLKEWTSNYYMEVGFWYFV